MLDVKRGDIGSTMDAYAGAYLADGSPLAADAITFSPYLGFASLAGAVELARGTAGASTSLALTSNPEGPELQHARVADGTLRRPGRRRGGRTAQPARRPGPAGLVVGATIGRTGVDFSGLNGSILAPGLGAQGATAADLAQVFGAAGPLVLPSTSREVMSAGPDPVGLQAVAAGSGGDGSRPRGGVSFQASDRQRRTRPVTIPPLSDEQRQQAGMPRPRPAGAGQRSSKPCGPVNGRWPRC